MTWLQAIIVYGVCWWLLLFMALPFGVQSVDVPAEGESNAAPRKTYLPIKCLIVTILTAFLTWGIDLLVGSGIVAVK